MISSVRGPVLSALGSTVVIEVGGIGLAVQVTQSTALSARIGQEALLMTTLIVREDSLTLYGFPSAHELAVFELLVGVTGVGPKSALGVLAALTPNQIARAVQTEDDGAFRKVSGIGPKTAKLIVVSLAGKLQIAPADSAEQAGAGAVGTVASTVQSALIGLGWPEKVAAQVVDETMKGATEAEQAVVATILRLSLSRLGPAKHTVGSRS